MRAGARVRDLEFVQFHPTVMWLGAESTGQQPLISEAVRGEGAFLVDDDGDPFMQGVHEMADLAPRDVVAKAIMRRMREKGTDHVWLDARAFGEAKWHERFPTILEVCRSHGIDPVTDLIPVAPACHYASGGIETDLFGRSSVRGLYACGEVACSGVHGANRLASNSLLEGLVFGRRIADRLGEELPPRQQPADDTRTPGLVDESARQSLQTAMTEWAGVLRNDAGLTHAWAMIDQLADKASTDAERRRLGDHQPADRRCGHRRRGRRPHRDPRLPLARGFPRARRRALGRPPAGLAACRSRRRRVRARGGEGMNPSAAATSSLTELAEAGVDIERLLEDVRRAVDEDVPTEDVTSVATIPEKAIGVADFVARADGVVAGIGVAELVLRHVSGARSCSA